MKSALNILYNQVKCPELYDECFRLGCDVNDKFNDNVNDLLSNFANNNNVTDNRGTCFADDLRSSFANNFNDNDNVKDNVIYQFDEKHQRGKPNNKECSTNTISININEGLQLWRNDDKIITEATLQENFRFIISGPSECGKTFLLKKLILSCIYFDKLIHHWT